jgi:hypothetical protein
MAVSWSLPTVRKKPEFQNQFSSQRLMFETAHTVQVSLIPHSHPVITRYLFVMQLSNVSTSIEPKCPQHKCTHLDAVCSRAYHTAECQPAMRMLRSATSDSPLPELLRPSPGMLAAPSRLRHRTPLRHLLHTIPMLSHLRGSFSTCY